MIRSYIIETTYDWIIDHNLTPYLLADSEYKNIILPKDYIDNDGKILFNVSTEAVNNFQCDDNDITFNATFNGKITFIKIPIEAVLELYSGETSQGLYAREFGYGIDINEGETNNDINPQKKHIKKYNINNTLKLV